MNSNIKNTIKQQRDLVFPSFVCVTNIKRAEVIKKIIRKTLKRDHKDQHGFSQQNNLFAIIPDQLLENVASYAFSVRIKFNETVLLKKKEVQLFKGFTFCISKIEESGQKQLKRNGVSQFNSETREEIIEVTIESIWVKLKPQKYDLQKALKKVKNFNEALKPMSENINKLLGLNLDPKTNFHESIQRQTQTDSHLNDSISSELILSNQKILRIRELNAFQDYFKTKRLGISQAQLIHNLIRQSFVIISYHPKQEPHLSLRQKKFFICFLDGQQRGWPMDSSCSQQPRARSQTSDADLCFQTHIYRNISSNFCFRENIETNLYEKKQLISQSKGQIMRINGEKYTFEGLNFCRIDQ